MGFRIRKSINLGGGFRVNISKKGVGYSWGVPGYRVTKTSKGTTRRTYSIPGSGVSYVTESSKNSARNTSNSHSQKSSVQKQINNEYDNFQNEESAGIENFQPVEYSELIKKIQHAMIINATLLVSVILIGIISYLISYFVFFSLTLLAILAYACICFKVLPITLDYEFESDDFSQEYLNRLEIWKKLNTSQKVWKVTQTATIKNRKNSAGAGINIKRGDLKISSRLPYYIKTNIECIVLKSDKETLIFLPDKILIEKQGSIGVLNYSELNCRVYTREMVEYNKNSVPKDAIMVSQSWLHPNKDGSRDKRYSDNRLVPVYNYGHLDLTSHQGLNFKIMFSNAALTEDLNLAIKQNLKPFSNN